MVHTDFVSNVHGGVPLGGLRLGSWLLENAAAKGRGLGLGLCLQVRDCLAEGKLVSYRWACQGC